MIGSRLKELSTRERPCRVGKKYEVPRARLLFVTRVATCSPELSLTRAEGRVVRRGTVSGRQTVMKTMSEKIGSFCLVFMSSRVVETPLNAQSLLISPPAVTATLPIERRSMSDLVRCLPKRLCHIVSVGWSRRVPS